MELNARQLGRIEAACCALTKLLERSDVGTLLIGLIREQLAAGAESSALPESAGLPEKVRVYGRELIRQGAGIVPTIRMICEHYDMTQKELAAIIGTSETTVSTALSGAGIRQTLLCRMTEFFGDGKED